MEAKILYIHHGSARGGAPLSLLYMVQGMAKHGITPVVCSATCDPEVIDLFKRQNIATITCKLLPFIHTSGGQFRLLSPVGWWRAGGWLADYPHAVKRLKGLIKSVNPNIVHLNSLVLAPYVKALHESGIPSIVHVREYLVDGLLGVRKRWLKRCLDKYADKVVCISKDNRDTIGLKRKRGIVIHNFAGFSKFDCRISKADARAKLNIPGDAEVVLFAGGLIQKIKGGEEFLTAMGIVNRKRKGVRCLMPGFAISADEDKKNSFRNWLSRVAGYRARRQKKAAAIIEREKLTGLIHAFEFMFEMELCIAASDVVCIFHTEPHFSRLVIEAGAMKKPVVAFRISGVQEYVSDGHTGLLVEVGDIAAAANAIVTLLADEELRKEMGENSYVQARECFSMEENTSKLLEVYRELL